MPPCPARVCEVGKSTLAVGSDVGPDCVSAHVAAHWTCMLSCGYPSTCRLDTHTNSGPLKPHGHTLYQPHGLLAEHAYISPCHACVPAAAAQRCPVLWRSLMLARVYNSDIGLKLEPEPANQAGPWQHL
jgi:hypothetical protein